ELGVLKDERIQGPILDQRNPLVGDCGPNGDPEQNQENHQDQDPGNDPSWGVFFGWGLETSHLIRTTWTCFGPCTPTLRVCSISAVRLGPVTITRLAVPSTLSGY